MLAVALPLHAPTLDGRNIHSTSTGKGSKTLVLVHGWTCDETSWVANDAEGRAGSFALSAAAFMKKVFPNITYVEMPGTGHFVMMEQPEEFNRLLMRFVETL